MAMNGEYSAYYHDQNRNKKPAKLRKDELTDEERHEVVSLSFNKANKTRQG